MVLGLDTRTYDDDGRIMEIPFIDLTTGQPARPGTGMRPGVAALSGYGGEDGGWVLVTWR